MYMDPASNSYGIAISPCRLLRRLQAHLIANADAGRAKLGHHQPQLHPAPGAHVRWDDGTPLVAGAADRCVGSARGEWVRLIVQGVCLAQKEGLYTRRQLQGKAVLEHAPGRDPGPPVIIEPVHRCAARQRMIEGADALRVVLVPQPEDQSSARGRVRGSVYGGRQHLVETGLAEGTGRGQV